MDETETAAAFHKWNAPHAVMLGKYLNWRTAAKSEMSAWLLVYICFRFAAISIQLERRDTFGFFI